MSALDAGAKVVAVEKLGRQGDRQNIPVGLSRRSLLSGKKRSTTNWMSTDMDYFNSCEDQSVKPDETHRQAVQAMIERSASILSF